MSGWVYAEGRAPVSRRFRWMAEQLNKSNDWITRGIALLPTLLMLAIYLMNGGSFVADTKTNMIQLQETVKEIKSGQIDNQRANNARFDAIQDRIDKSPRADQFADLIRINAEQDGRMNAMERRLGELEKQNAVQAIQIQNLLGKVFGGFFKQ